ncbi:NfeD family protein [Puniceicoccus vermicola]|uniref:ATP-dependent Clp protease proteolytic subunit n=1 Tax=Puniceicoccus vermicola TaxID=388746 RepID=A0A7X1E4F4_9BACT|nr:NfeD family protein [Puniceicoccus vermicola]MBC2602495.1 ATP-dependent Clp protease proteolytic subunit [Puniceicoccus vermicola]
MNLFFYLCTLSGSLVAQEVSSPQETEPTDNPAQPETSAGQTEATRSVYILPIQGQITTPTFYILRRGLKAAEENGIETVIIDMNTPGGSLGPTLEIMEALDSFSGEVYTYIDTEAMSAGAFISIATDRIYFNPKGIIGAAEAVSGTGQDIGESMQRKLNSYIQAKVRSLTADYRYRADVMRAMSDPKYVLEIDGNTLKGEDELLSLTASEAMKEYGEPPQALLGSGIFDSIDALLDNLYGPSNYEIRSFEVTWSESLAHYLNTIAPLLMGAGMLCLFIEFKTPGFGIFGIGGILILGVVFISSHIAGLAGYEALLFFILGIGLFFVELFLLPGLVFPAVIGIILILGSLIWSLADIWPDQPIDWNGGTFTEPILDLVIGMVIAIVGAILLARFLPKTWIWNKLVLQSAVGRPTPGPQGASSGGNRPANTPSGWPDLGATGTAITDLFPNGEVEIDGKRYQAKSRLSLVEHGTPITVTGYQDFALTVEPTRRKENHHG